ncbi:MAG: hypothetical protein EHM48_09075, partial [Planctomycetaceae bacterium]
MAISFEIFPSYRRASMRQIELKGVKRSTASPYIPEKVLIVGQFLAAKTGVTAGQIVQKFTADEVADYFGYGSEIHRQALWIFDALGGFSENVYCVAVPAPTGDPAVGTVTFTGATTGPGTWPVSIGGTLYQLNVSSGTSDDDQAAALVAAITADVSAPFTAAVGGTGSENIVTITCKQKGTNGNQHYMMLNPSGDSQLALNPPGGAVTFTALNYFTGGTGDPVVTGVFDAGSGVDNLGNTWYTLITCPYQDATALGVYKSALTARMEASPNRLAGSVVGYTKPAYSAMIAIPATINSRHIAPVWDPRCLHPAPEFGAAVLGLVAASASIDPGRPFMGLELPLAVKSGVFDDTYSRVDALFRAGGGYCKLSPSGTLMLGDIALSYRLTSAGAATEEWFALVQLTLRQVKAYQAEQKFLSDPYTRGMVGSNDIVTGKDYVIKPNKVVADMYALVDNWAAEGWTKNIETVKATISAEINARYNSRIDATIDDDSAGALRIIAVRLRFRY